MKCLFLVVVVEELPPVALRILVRLAAFTALSAGRFTFAAAGGIFLASRFSLTAARFLLAAFGVNPIGRIYDNGAVAYLERTSNCWSDLYARFEFSPSRSD